jgi:hypothetical protein
MTEHRVCKGCGGNKYPECQWTKCPYGLMKIDDLNESFQCGIRENLMKVEYLENGALSWSPKTSVFES